ncbi:MAG: hypothetical protein IRY83_11120, partial [Chloroflexi bacterium]|nr:hypothetical protein [Chloroflexota bacterium]
ERGYLKNLLPSGWEEFAKNVLTDMKRQHGIRFTPEEQQIFKENFKHGMKDGYNRILSKFAPTIGRRSRTLKKQIRQIRGKDKATKEIMHLYNPESMDPWEFLKKRASLLRWGR